MNVAYVSFVSPESVSGENAFMLGLANSVARQPGVRLFLICPPPTQGPDEMLAQAVTMIYLPQKESGSLRWTLGVQVAILRALKEVERLAGKPDGIVVALRAGAIVPALYSRLKRVPEVLVVESLEARNVARMYGHMPGSGLLMSLITWVNGLQSRKVFAAFEAVREWVQAMPLVDPTKVERFHHGVDAAHYQLGDAESLRRSLSLPFSSEDFVVGFAGSFKWYHRVDLLLRAAAEPVLEHAKLLLVGQGPTLEECQRIASDLGVQDRVHFTGNVSHDRVGSLLSACDALYGVIDPRHWGHAMKLYEYMASAAPFVYVVNDETRFIQDMGVGRGIATASVPDIARALADVSSQSPDQRRALTEKGRSFVLKECSWDRLASRIVSEFEHRGSSE